MRIVNMKNYTAQDWADEVRVDDWKVVDALFNAIHEGLDEAGVPDKLRDKVFHLVNEECIIRTQ